MNKNSHRIDIKNNCLSLIRLLAAFSVMYGHVITHLDIHIPEYVSKYILFIYGVPTFFAISGMLIWKSIERISSFNLFIKRRVFRIYPELWASIAFNFLVMHMLYDDFKTGGIKIVFFGISQGTVFQFWTPDFLRGYGCGTPNGSLWTIGVIVQSYVVLYFTYRLLHGKKNISWITSILFFVLLSLCDNLLQSIFPNLAFKLYKQSFISYYWLFLIGAYISEFFDLVVPFLKKYWIIFLLFNFAFYLLNIEINNSGYGILRCTLLVLWLVGFAYAYPCLKLNRDISFGLYLYHMIVVNAMIQLGFTGEIKYLLYCILISVVLAYVSTSSIGSWSAHKKVSL